ncbi:MAG: hydrogenase maturation nickel metallochaperone HypA [Candidatus Omnitrophota bacterium]
MHEFSIVKKEVKRLSHKINGKKVSKVVFSLGRLSHGTPESIKEAFQTITVDTGLSVAEFEVLSIDPRIKCLSCGAIYGIENDINLKCPSCGSSSNEVIAGQECYISSVEID